MEEKSLKKDTKLLHSLILPFFIPEKSAVRFKFAMDGVTAFCIYKGFLTQVEKTVLCTRGSECEDLFPTTGCRRSLFGKNAECQGGRQIMKKRLSP